jgi:hypothetical protein
MPALQLIEVRLNSFDAGNLIYFDLVLCAQPLALPAGGRRFSNKLASMLKRLISLFRLVRKPNHIGAFIFERVSEKVAIYILDAETHAR